MFRVRPCCFLLVVFLLSGCIVEPYGEAYFSVLNDTDLEIHFIITPRSDDWTEMTLLEKTLMSSDKVIVGVVKGISYSSPSWTIQILDPENGEPLITTVVPELTDVAWQIDDSFEKEDHIVYWRLHLSFLLS